MFQFRTNVSFLVEVFHAKNQRENRAMVQSAIKFLKELDQVLNALVIDPERALEELNNDWTASQEIADVLMRQYKIPFRVGHHFASHLVDYAKKHNIKPLDFPYAQAQQIYKDSVKELNVSGDLPMSEAEFRSTLDPVAIVNNRRTSGGSQPAEVSRMMELARKQVSDQSGWIDLKAQQIDVSLRRLDADFDTLRATQ